MVDIFEGTDPTCRNQVTPLRNTRSERGPRRISQTFEIAITGALAASALPSASINPGVASEHLSFRMVSQQYSEGLLRLSKASMDAAWRSATAHFKTDGQEANQVLTAAGQRIRAWSGQPATPSRFAEEDDV